MTKLRLSLLPCLLFGLAGLQPAAAASLALTCPPQHKSGEAPAAGWWSAKRNEPQRLTRKDGVGRLDGLWVVEGKRGEETAEAPAILMPDTNTPKGQEWAFGSPNAGILLVCLYRGSEEVLATQLPASMSHCQWRPRESKNGLEANGTLACR